MKHVSRPGRHADGGNLYLQVRKATRKSPSDGVTKSWLFRYSRFGKDTWMELGPYPDVSLSEARILKNLAGPIIGHLSVDQIDTALVMRCIEPIWATKTETASRLPEPMKSSRPGGPSLTWVSRLGSCRPSA